ncbi:MAG: hypothetical protein JHD16_16845 [Solirubrobacteraceae bacterium]|nr:hypothetical protein [Solirubrobacteraceae bacterium]
MTAATTPIDLRQQERVVRVLAPLSLLHSIVYATMLTLMFSDGPEGIRSVLGWTHGLMWIGLSLVCVTAASRRLLPVRTALAVAVLGGVGPFIGTYEFMRLRRNGGATFRST